LIRTKHELFLRGYIFKKNSYYIIGRSERMKGKRELQEKATSYFCNTPLNFPKGRPLNCCETVLITLAEQIGIKSNLIPRIGTGIGAGVPLNGLLCGSISGVVMIIGIEQGRDNPEMTLQKSG
jgi:Putative redox-active protein (C_GCAxxG_C_C)